MGTLLSTWIALHPVGSENDALDEILVMFRELTPDKFWKFWPHYVVEPFTEKSFVNSEDFIKVLDSTIADRPFQRKISF